mmetsp:Transcript_12028/g.12043  ORF Transcript_12028/g.12043 Transcript_12028/m.12043 type:complete len:180 (-) Transcript_12028:12-551(-)
MTCPTCRKDLNNLYKPAIEKFNGGPDLDANQIRDLYAEDILEMQNKMVVVINDLEEVDDENFDSFEFVSNPEIQLEENKENQDGKSANEESKLAAQISDADYGRNRPSMLVSRNLMNSNNLRNIDNPGEARMNQSVYQIESSDRRVGRDLHLHINQPSTNPPPALQTPEQSISVAEANV